MAKKPTKKTTKRTSIKRVVKKPARKAAKRQQAPRGWEGQGGSQGTPKRRTPLIQIDTPLTPVTAVSGGSFEVLASGVSAGTAIASAVGTVTVITDVQTAFDAILARVTQLETLVAALNSAPNRDGIGGNFPPVAINDEQPVTRQDWDALTRSITYIREQQAAFQGRVEDVLRVESTSREIGGKIIDFLRRRGQELLTGATVALGGAAVNAALNHANAFGIDALTSAGANAYDYLGANADRTKRRHSDLATAARSSYLTVTIA